ncbi:MAG: PAS domain S-box protein [Prolixibacteraceae bacterium]|jgi:PAS domain S-box-containing protein
MNKTVSKILIVDDNTFYLSLLKTILREVDAEVYMASSGKDALDLIHKNDFALAVLDIQMPEMDGFELAGHIRNLKYRDLLPIIFLTAYFSDEIQMFKGYDNGAIDYLTKPVTKNIFASKVKIFLELDQQKKNLIASKDSLQESKLELEKKQLELKLQNDALRVAQKETEESRKKYIKLYDFAPSGYFTINNEAEIYEINLKGAKLLGRAPDNISHYNFNEFLEPEIKPVFNDFLNKLFNNESPSGCELKLKSINGKPLFVYLEGAKIEENQTCLLSMVDITDRKEAQLALKESEELYHSLLKTSPDGIIITDLDGQIIEASDYAHELLGDSGNKIEGRLFNDFIPANSQRTFVKIYSRTVKEGMVQNYEIKLNRVDRSDFIAEISLSQIKGNDGGVRGFMSVIRDISERKLFEKQLRHSERMAGIGELATGMSHEINQPLNTISLSLDNVMFSIENNTCNENYLKTKINKVFDNISRIKKIIDHVRTFSRDQDDFTQSDFEINTSIKNSISMVSEQFLQKEISINFHPDPNIPTISGNAYRFEQVILNMLINAKDAVEERKKKNCKKYTKKIDITTNLNDKLIVVEIKDNGIGISQEDIDKVLLPFFTTKAPGHGTGLGLSISYGIIKELGGEIDIASKPNFGTTIQLKIPVQNSRINKYPNGYVQ